MIHTTFCAPFADVPVPLRRPHPRRPGRRPRPPPTDNPCVSVPTPKFATVVRPVINPGFSAVPRLSLVTPETNVDDATAAAIWQPIPALTGHNATTAISQSLI